ncbi:uncharacterized protein RBU47_014027 [Passerculus sandwichensis]
MAFASLLEHVGGMGRFQVLSVLLLSLPVLMMASHNLLQNFTAATSDHWCRPSPGANATGLDAEALLRVWVPRGERCRRFVTPQWWLLETNSSEATNSSWPETEPCGDGWSYDRSVFTSTIITEWDLVCSSRGLKQLAQSLYMAGVLVGGLFGGLSDRFGRRSVLTWCYLQMAAMGTCSSFAPTFSVYCLFRFLTGMAFSGIVLNSVSLSLEWMPTHMRALVGTFMGYCYTAGQFLLAGVAFVVPDWRQLQLVVSLPFFGFFLYSWWLTESARWLVMVGRSHQALRELQKVARINGKKEEGDKLDIETLRSHMEKEMTSSNTRHTVVDLVRTPVLRRISFCLCFVWFSTSFAYYGLAMDLQNFEFNIYVIQLIFGAVDIPAKLVSILTITYVGRRFTQAAALILAGLAILGNVLVPRDLRTLRTALAVFGKGCLAASFNCVFLYTGELYPTVIRQTGMGMANTMSRLGSIMAPLVKMAGELFPALPFVIYGAAPVVSGLVAAFLPETRNVALPETVEEVEGRPRSHKDESRHLQVPLHPTPSSNSTGPHYRGGSRGEDEDGLRGMKGQPPRGPGGPGASDRGTEGQKDRRTEGQRDGRRARTVPRVRSRSGRGRRRRTKSRAADQCPVHPRPSPAMSFVELLSRLGGMGRFQVTYVAALAVPLLMLASHNLLQNFTAGVPEHHCRPRPAANATEVPLAVSIPRDGRRRPQSCRRYVEPQWHLLDANASANGTEAATEPCHDGWTYLDGIFSDTIVTEWDLVCDSKKLRQVAQSIYMAGILLGSSLFGILSDKFGRRALLTWCYLQLGATGVGTAAAPSLLVYCVCRFLTGLAMAGVSLNSASLCMEWIPTEARAVVGTINGYCYTLGQFVLAAAAFGLPRWRQLQLAVSLPFFVFFFYSWLYVESARWQVTSGRPDLALRGLRKVARVNGRKEEGDKLSEEALRALVRREPPLPGGAVAALVRTPGMRTVSCGVSFVWFSTSFAYYGLAMDLQGFGFNVYLSQLVFGAVDIPAKLLSVLVISCLGRRLAQGGSLALAGLCILANIFVPGELPTLRMAFAVVGKGALAASFNCAYIFSGELFPTVIRQTGMGLGGTMARVGSMVAPLVRMLADVTPVLPLVIYGAAPIVSAIATCFLPETRNAPLPETVKDVERRAGHLDDDDVAVPLSSTSTKDGA